MKRVIIVVLGDIGRSPRMCYHALSLAKMNIPVVMIGYYNAQPLNELLKNPLIQIKPLWPVPKSINALPSILRYFMKIFWQFLTLLLSLLFLCRKPSHIMVQNPPGVPALIVVWLVARLRCARMVVDWHNYGFTILACSLQNNFNQPMVRMYRALERMFGRFSDYNFCVTEAMSTDLVKNWNISATVLYDKPANIFKPLSHDEIHDFFMNFKSEYPIFEAHSGDDDATILTNSRKQLCLNRPAFIVSSTSWTEDEDFSILLHAFDIYDLHLRQSPESRLPPIICAITGKGPLKEFYKEEINKHDWSHVRIITPWLSAADYPKLIGSADFGISLHTSSSGLDLPMKVVDMFGCGIPVCAVHFPCISELVQHEVSGLVFSAKENSNSSDSISPRNSLFQQIEVLLTNFPNNKLLSQYRENIRNRKIISWDDSWNAFAKPFFEN